MTFHRTAAIARKEIIQAIRDARSLGLVVAMPIITMFAFGYAVSLDVKGIPTCVYDREGSRRSQDLLARFAASPYFDIQRALSTDAAVVAAIDHGECQLAIVVPADFSARLDVGGPTLVQALVDASDSNSASLGIGYSEGVVRLYSSRVQLDWLGAHGQARFRPPLVVDARTWYNEDLASMAAIVPGVVALVMAVVGTFLTSLTISREWERGTMEQLVSTPITPLELMVGKLTPYFLIGMADTAVCVLLGVLWFRVPFRGSWLVLAACSSLFLIVVLSLGYLISVASRSQLNASRLALLSTFLPAFLLSGFLYPIDQMPRVIQWITLIVPARYFVALIRDVFLKGSPLPLLAPQLLALALFASLVTLLATRAFEKKI